ncbi:methyltransferase domain-containing protein [Candidatus Wolfebacteria bacterium]|nr:methyltransferase domain-containing protein [Candidatus Wolfebacteria bacterium]
MPWYKDFFEGWYLSLYLPQRRFKPTYIKKETVFIKRVLNLPKGAKILDLCCGHGRHLLPLAKMGYQMTGFDLSKKALNVLTKRIKKEKVKIRIIRGDMRKIPFKNEFDAVINMFTAFGYLETDYEDFKVLKAVVRALKPGRKFLIDIINRDRLLANFQPKSREKIGKLTLLQERVYNAKTHRNTVKFQILDEKGRWHKAKHVVRIYSLKEMRENLNKAGLKIIKVYGDTIGNQKFSKKSRRLVILAQKN